MRHIKLFFAGEPPSDRELYEQLRRAIGLHGLINGEVRVRDGIVSCNRKWVGKVKGALALKWQFRALVSGTLNRLRKAAQSQDQGH